VTHVYIKPSSNQRCITAREASAAGRLRSNGILGTWRTFGDEDLPLGCNPELPPLSELKTIHRTLGGAWVYTPTV
jgi:hypothetical protein